MKHDVGWFLHFAIDSPAASMLTIPGVILLNSAREWAGKLDNVSSADLSLTVTVVETNILYTSPLCHYTRKLLQVGVPTWKELNFNLMSNVMIHIIILPGSAPSKLMVMEADSIFTSSPSCHGHFHLQHTPTFAFVYYLSHFQQGAELSWFDDVLLVWLMWWCSCRVFGPAPQQLCRHWAG